MPRSESREREASPGANHGNNLYIANLSYQTREEDLQDLFAKFGKIKYCKVIRDPVSKESRGFGFVTFEDAAEAQEAIKQLNNTEVSGRKLHIEEAKRAAPYSPTPGKYMGHSREKSDGKRSDRDRDRDRDRRRSPSPRRRRRSISRSRSHSPHRRRRY